ncbi:MAG: hypothetical protein ACREDZ_10330 [Kiloniellales bacterium]
MVGKRAASIAGLVLSASIALSIGGNAAAQEIMCKEAVEDAWSAAGVDRTDVRETLAVRRTGNNSARVDYDIYTRFDSCSGALIVQVNNRCFVRQVYTIGDCSLPGVPSFP